MSKPKHHIRQEVCLTRAPYRDGRKPTAVKVYTIHHESKYLLVQGVSATGVGTDLVKLFETVGDVEEHKILDDYPSEQFTEVHLVKYKRIQSARFAKRKFDDWSFFGGILHVCYAPEFETVQETREKLRERRRVVEAKTKQCKSDGTYSNSFIQTSSSSTVTKEEDFGNTDSPRQAIENGGTNFDTINNQYYSSAYPNEQTQNFTNTSYQNAQQYGVHDQPSYFSDTNQNYGGQSAPPQQNLPSGSNLQNHIAHSIIGNSGTIEQPQTNVRNQQTSKSYGEHVVQQAQSLQNYGKSAILNRVNVLKRQNIESSVTDNSDNSESIETTHHPDLDNEEQFILPPPPKQMRFTDRVFRKSQNYGGAKVPSAQATFPANFDARTDQVKTSVSKIEDSDSLKTDLDNKSEIVSSKEKLDISNVKTMQDKVEENLKSKNIVIKEFSKKTTVPKFIPRQALIRNKTGKATDKTKTENGSSKTNELNKEIRKNALMLGKVQGPADLGPSVSKESLDPKEKSVINSTLEIRRKLKEIKD